MRGRRRRWRRKGREGGGEGGVTGGERGEGESGLELFRMMGCEWEMNAITDHFNVGRKSVKFQQIYIYIYIYFLFFFLSKLTFRRSGRL